jgi:DnaJ-class molecular chaperone
MSEKLTTSSPSDPEEEKMRECPECSGSGEVGYVDMLGDLVMDGCCPTCHGTGLVPAEEEGE